MLYGFKSVFFMENNNQNLDKNIGENNDYLKIVFAQRNQEYGAYDLRKNYNTHLKNAVFGMIFTTFALAALAFFARPLLDVRQNYIPTMVMIKTDPTIAPLLAPPPPPPPPPRSTVYFLPPKLPAKTKRLTTMKDTQITKITTIQTTKTDTILLVKNSLIN